MTEIIVSIITGTLTLIGVCITAWASSKKTRDDLSKAQAVTDTKLDELTREVREHNQFAQRVPVLESRMSDLDRRLTAVEKHA